MEDKDYIKELFAKKLKNHSEKVNPEVWTAVKTQMAASAATTVSLTSKLIIGVLATATIVTVVYLVTGENTTGKVSEIEQNSIPIHKDITEKKDINKEKKKSEIAFRNNEIFELATKPDVVPVKKSTQNVKATNSQEETNKVYVLNDINKMDSVAAAVNETDKEYIEEKQQSSKEVTQQNNKELTLPTFSIRSKKEGDVFIFSLDTDDYDFIEWSFGDGNYSTLKKVSHVYNSSGKYEVKARIVKGDLQKTTSVWVGKEAVGKISKLPSVVTCNNDGFNDALVLETENLVDFQITILNRSNQVVFKSADVNFSWNGVDLKGEPVEPGNYVYIITAMDTAGNAINEYQMIEVRR